MRRQVADFADDIEVAKGDASCVPSFAVR